MKCLYAIPSESVDAAKGLCSEYAKFLESCSVSAVAQGDELRAFVENAGGPALQLDDDDWDMVKAKISAESASGRALVGEIFWLDEDAKSIATALRTHSGAATQTVANWLQSQVVRGRSVVLLAK